MRHILHNESNESFIHNFHVFKVLPLNIDGILGQAFLAKYVGVLSFGNKKLTLNENNRFLYITFQCLLD